MRLRAELLGRGPLLVNLEGRSGCGGFEGWVDDDGAKMGDTPKRGIMLPVGGLSKQVCGVVHKVRGDVEAGQSGRANQLISFEFDVEEVLCCSRESLKGNLVLRLESALIFDESLVLPPDDVGFRALQGEASLAVEAEFAALISSVARVFFAAW